MIPIDVEHRIAVYFLHRYLPEEVLIELEGALLPLCLMVEEEEELDKDELVKIAIQIIELHLDEKRLK
ncbi:hypothetical protein SAMN05421736_1471 [Evansella caseinilytica]|uniref:Uncharacterized protein n=1 Tax=Evansella caseinilytica TaxID=1503961 RepID=A0A1H3V3A4_9BACI|nr:hypothetical protein [Evansella caseinilytica]SDZ69087.1 hypothetical protein SAMN05421736_1471 [Evansella caseinilytica]